MDSLCYSLQDLPSSITQTMTDEFDAILMELQGYSLDTFERKYEKRTSTFSAIRAEEKKTQGRVQDLPEKLKKSTEGMQRKIDRLSAEVVKKEEEGTALESRYHYLAEEVERKEGEIEKLQEREKLLNALIEVKNVNINLIKSGSQLIRRIDKRCPCPNPG